MKGCRHYSVGLGAGKAEKRMSILASRRPRGNRPRAVVSMGVNQNQYRLTIGNIVAKTLISSDNGVM